LGEIDGAAKPESACKGEKKNQKKDSQEGEATEYKGRRKSRDGRVSVVSKPGA